MFDEFGNARLSIWRDFRISLESSNNPLRDVAQFWAKAPFVNNFLDPFDNSSWPDPWHLILDNHYDDLAIVLGMCYTLSLTQRFSGTKFEIYKSINDKKNSKFYLVVSEQHVLNFTHGEVANINDFNDIDTFLIYTQ